MKAELWDDIERALDARRSPFADRALAARLAREPEAGAAARRLMERLGALERGAEVPRWRLAPAIVAVAALVVALLCLRSGGDTDAPRALDVRLSVHRETYAPRLARIEHEARRVVGWSMEGMHP
ncbi:MAG: hypothetical protein ABL998_10025 [Planctomycetota bacterium]